jgi:hypothetical protein
MADKANEHNGVGGRGTGLTGGPLYSSVHWQISWTPEVEVIRSWRVAHYIRWLMVLFFLPVPVLAASPTREPS